MQPLLIAGGGGGASARLPTASTKAPAGSTLSKGASNAQGLIDPWDSLEKWKAFVPNNDVDAGK